MNKRLGHKQHFYVDDKGVTQRYIYCTRCGGGPYKPTDTSEFQTTGEYTHCKKCIDELGLQYRVMDPVVYNAHKKSGEYVYKEVGKTKRLGKRAKRLVKFAIDTGRP